MINSISQNVALLHFISFWFQALIDHIDDTMSYIIKNCAFSATSLQLLCSACVECFAKVKCICGFTTVRNSVTIA